MFTFINKMKLLFDILRKYIFDSFIKIFIHSKSVLFKLLRYQEVKTFSDVN